tara:strand:- start:45 stop:377 length:333 start_codon:yes stop_codon:yes gene_type:complete
MKQTRIGWPEDKYPDSALSLYAEFEDLNRGRMFLDDHGRGWMILSEDIDYEHRLNDKDIRHRDWHFAVCLTKKNGEDSVRVGTVHHLSTITATEQRVVNYGHGINPFTLG